MKSSAVFMQAVMSPDAEAQFFRLAEEFAGLWRAMGLNTKATRHGEPVEFRRASPRAQHVAIAYLEFNLVVLKEMVASGESLKDTKVYLWRAIKKLGLTPPADLMSYVQDGDIVEIYFMDDIQAFRNYRFLELTSFTLDEMLCRPWYRNVSRPLISQLKVFRMAMRLKLGQIRSAVSWDVAEHELREKDTEGSHVFKIQLKHFIPLKSDSRVAAVVSTNHSRLIGRQKE